MNTRLSLAALGSLLALGGCYYPAPYAGYAPPPVPSAATQREVPIEPGTLLSRKTPPGGPPGTVKRDGNSGRDAYTGAGDDTADARGRAGGPAPTYEAESPEYAAPPDPGYMPPPYPVYYPYPAYSAYPAYPAYPIYPAYYGGPPWWGPSVSLGFGFRFGGGGHHHHH